MGERYFAEGSGGLHESAHVEESEEGLLLLGSASHGVEHLMEALAVIAFGIDSNVGYFASHISFDQFLRNHEEPLFKHLRGQCIHSGIASGLGQVGNGHALSGMDESLENDGFALGQGRGGIIEVGGGFKKCFALHFQGGRESRFHDIAGGAEIIVGNPFPEFELRVAEDGLIVKEKSYRFYFIAIGFPRGYGRDDTGVELPFAKLHNDPVAALYFAGHFLRDFIGESAAQRERENYFGKQSHDGKGGEGLFCRSGGEMVEISPERSKHERLFHLIVFKQVEELLAG